MKTAEKFSAASQPVIAASTRLISTKISNRQQTLQALSRLVAQQLQPPSDEKGVRDEDC